MAELIALNSESDSDEKMDTLMLLYLTSKRQKSVWKSEYMEKRKTHGEFALTSEFSDKQFTISVQIEANSILGDCAPNILFQSGLHVIRMTGII